MSNQGGFRYRGDLAGDLEMLLLTSNFGDPDWPDTLDREIGIFTYYGDNKEPGRLHDTGRRGNAILQRIFGDAHNGEAGRKRVPPIFVFRTGAWRAATFLGLAVPGSSDLLRSEDLVAIWHTSKGQRFQNCRARFTVLDATDISREWLNSLIVGEPDDTKAPAAWLNWRDHGRFQPLLSARSIEYRSRSEQLPTATEEIAMLRAIQDHFRERPVAFEHCAAALTRMMMPDVGLLDVTRPSRDGGRDGVGQLRIGTGPGSILVDFAMEAKLYTAPNAVNVRDMSRLISRLRHRQFGVLVTTSCIDVQAYREIKEDRHPIIIIAGVDIIQLLKASGRGTGDLVQEWLRASFPLLT